MASLHEQHKRAQRAKAKAKQTRIQRATAHYAPPDFIDFESLNLDDMFLGATSVELSTEERAGSFIMTAIIDHDEAYAHSPGDCPYCQPTKPDH